MKLYFRHYYQRWLKNLTFLFVFFACLMTLARLAFALYFGEMSELTSHLPEVKKAFWLGLRFDLMPLAYINFIPFLILHIAFFLPGKTTIRVTRFFMVTFLCLGYFLIAWLYVFDYGFYSYFQDHLNILVFGFFEDDTKALLISIYKNYNLILWLSLLFALHYGLYRFIKFLFSPFDFDLKAKKFNFRIPLCLVTGLVVLAFMARGNFSRLPLSLEDAFISDTEFINEIALNGALSLNRAIKIRKTHGKDNFNYSEKLGFSTWSEAYTAYLNSSPKSEDLLDSLKTKTPEKRLLKENPPHVVMVVMESFGSYWNDSDSEEFNVLGDLKEHFEKDYLFKNFLSAENGTIGSVVSIATSQVIRPGARFLSESEFMKVSLKSSGHLPFKKNGYDTHFIYGGKLGWRDLGKFLSVQKYDYLWGADEIKEAMPELSHLPARELGNEWGIFDEYLYAFIEEQLRTATKPQLFLVLTTSNHPPFEYPTSYNPKPLVFTPDLKSKITANEELTQKRFLGLQYANQKMGEFLTKIKTSSLEKNTIVGLTGDHSFWIAKGVGQEEEFKRYAVPFYLFVPDLYKPKAVNLNKFGSHEDIFPTLINLSLSDTTYTKLGEDLISEESFAINSSGLMANEQGAFHHGKFWKWANIKDQILEQTAPNPELKKLRSMGQGQIGLTDLYLKSEKSRKPIDAKNDRP